MQRDAVFSLLSQRLGNRSDLVSRMAAEAQLLQEIKLEQNTWLPWFLETELASTTTTAGEYRIQLPVDFLGEIEEQALWRTETSGELTPLKKMELDDMLIRYPGAGAPVAYAVGAEYFFLAHTPDAEYELKMRYFARDAALTTDIENKWLKYASDLVAAELGVIMAEKHMQHFELAQAFRKDAETAWTRLYHQHISRKEVNQNRVMEA